MNIRIVGFSASHRKDSNNDTFVKTALESARITPDVTTEFVSLAGKTIKPCTNCRACIKLGKCVLKDDWEECFRPLLDPIPNGVLFSTPVYFFNVNSQTRAFMERTTSLIKALYFKDSKQFPPDWSRTAAGAMAIGYDRNGGQEHAISTTLHWFLTNRFVTVSAGYLGYIGAPGWLMGEYQKDSILLDTELGIPCAKELGRRVATTGYLLKYGDEALKGVIPPEFNLDTAKE